MAKNKRATRDPIPPNPGAEPVNAAPDADAAHRPTIDELSPAAEAALIACLKILAARGRQRRLARERAAGELPAGDDRRNRENNICREDEETDVATA